MKKDHQDAILHFLMAMIGGFLGGYAIFARMNIFGSAQTANLIELIKNIFGANYVESLMRIGALLIYILSIMIATVLTYKSQWNLKHLVLYLEMICIVILGFIPEDSINISYEFKDGFLKNSPQQATEEIMKSLRRYEQDRISI